jgi:hypothetical protein
MKTTKKPTRAQTRAEAARACLNKIRTARRHLADKLPSFNGKSALIDKLQRIYTDAHCLAFDLSHDAIKETPTLRNEKGHHPLAHFKDHF